MTLISKFDSDLYGTINVFIDSLGREYYKVADVCNALRISNPTQVVNTHIDDQYILKVKGAETRGVCTNFVSEPGLYQLLFGVKTERAKDFQKWVFEQILPKYEGARYP